MASNQRFERILFGRIGSRIRRMRFGVVGVVLGLLGSVLLVPLPAVGQGGCSVSGVPGVLTSWSSSGSDLVADRVEVEFGVSLASLEPAFVWEVPVCVGNSGGVGLAGVITQVASSGAGAFESAAVSDALVLLMAGSYRPVPELSPGRGEVQWAGLESWLAVDPSGFVGVGPVTGSAGGVDVSASAVPVGTVWTFGDGSVVECLGPGELFVAGGPVDAPCGKEWEHTSAVQAHAVQVAVRYEVSWSSSLGGSGVLSRVGGSLGAFGLFVDELQAVGVFGDRDRPELIGLPDPVVGVTPDCSLVMYASGECGDPVDGLGDGEVDDGECGALSGPLRDIIAAGGASAEEAVAQIEAWADELGVADAASGIRDWLANRGRDAAGWVNDNVVGHVVDAGQWVYAQGAEHLAAYADEVRWVQGAAGELWGVVDGAVVAQAAGVVEGGRIVFRGAVAVADQTVQQFKQDIGTLRDGAELLADAVASTGIGEHLGVGIEIIEGAGDVAVAVGECVVWLGAETYNAIPDVLKDLPILGGLSLENMIGCAKALGGRVADIGGIVQMVAGAAGDPSGAVAEAEAAIRGLVDAVLEDPAGVALQFGKDLSHYHLQEEGKTGQWVGAVACEIAMEVALAYVTAGTYTAARVGTFGPKIAGIITKLDNLMPSNVIRRVLDRDGNGSIDADIDLDNPSAEVREIFECNSFPGDTNVLLGDGSLRAISELTVGDEVVSHDLDSGEWNINKVTDVWSAAHTEALVTIGVGGGGFTSTSDHLVWSESDSTWTEADELLPGDTVLTPAGPETVLVTTSNVAGDGIVWDITVANDHNFLVTNPANGPPILVHNCDIEYITDADGNPIGLRRTTESGDVIEVTPGGKLITGPDGFVALVNPDGSWEVEWPDGSSFGSDDLPESWFNSRGQPVFDPDRDLDFIERLREFGGSPIADKENFRGGEGQLFFSPDDPTRTLKRWVEARIDETTGSPGIESSIRKLEDAREAVMGDPVLRSVIDVVEIHDRGPDWIVRDFDPDSIEMSRARQDPNLGSEVEAAYQRALNQLANSSDPVLKGIYDKLQRESANIHWSPGQGKFLVIDMQ